MQKPLPGRRLGRALGRTGHDPGDRLAVRGDDEALPILHPSEQAGEAAIGLGGGNELVHAGHCSELTYNAQRPGLRDAPCRLAADSTIEIQLPGDLPAHPEQGTLR